ncbi:hypothetical protein [Burkholderia cepacia]|uniref:hypothetical protein n=1 Tax=Burkholderia cepacia TaxID=292 RepID=UPI00398F778A
MNIIPFMFVARRIIPELGPMPKGKVHRILESAGSYAPDCTKRRYRYSLIASIFMPFPCVFSLCTWLGLLRGSHSTLVTPIVSAISVYLSLLMLSILGSLVYSADIRRALKSPPQS